MPHLLKDGVSDFRIFGFNHLFRQAEGIKEDPKIYIMQMYHSTD